MQSTGDNKNPAGAGWEILQMPKLYNGCQRNYERPSKEMGLSFALAISALLWWMIIELIVALVG